MSSRAKKILYLATAAVLLTASSFLQRMLNRERATLGITRIEPLENAPPMLALTTQVLGGFRGLIANALWVRASQMQDEGKYFEQVQLADSITKLEPHIMQVWMVQSWNMAFNISVKFPDYSDRWRWVRRGVELLRDEALRYNPNQPLLYADLAWLFQFKMGQNLDDAHFFYKGAWAIEMMELFDGERPNFERLVNPQTPDEQRRARLLREKYKMDPARMRALDEHYGPLDWRLPEAHAIYWSAVGIDHAQGEDIRRLRQGIYQSMLLAYQRGRLILSSNAPPRYFPNLAMVPKVNAAYIEQWADATANAPFQTNGIATAYRNFLRDVPYQFFLFNRLREGQQWLKYLREKFPQYAPEDVTLAEYAVNRANETAGEQSQVRINTLVGGFVWQSYAAQIEGNREDAAQLMNNARDLWKAYTSKTQNSQRPQLNPLNEIQDLVLKDMLAPDSGLAPEDKLRLRTLEPRADELAREMERNAK